MKKAAPKGGLIADSNYAVTAVEPVREESSSSDRSFLILSLIHI